MSGSIFLHGYLAEFAKYNNARTAIEACFTGLPHAPARLVNLLITKANPETGIVENITYSDLATLLTVDSSPGRKDSGTPQKQTIRSYLRTIESQCGADFKIISDGQMLKIQFPTLSAIYASYFDYTELYTDQNTVSYTVTPLINIDENAIFGAELNTEEYTQPYTDEYTAKPVDTFNACAKIKPNKIKPNNNTVSDEFVNFKKPIGDDFFPSQFVFDKALELGLPKVTDVAELNKFILFNKASGSQWNSWDYVYLMWLQRDAERERAAIIKEQQLNNKPVYLGGKGHESSKRQTITQRVISAWSDEQIEFCQQTRRFKPRAATAAAPVKYLDFDTLDATY